MCGIAGIYNLDGDSVNRSSLAVFTDSMSHRGPDGSGYELLNDGQIGLAHRRLAILDLTEAGHQPMFLANRYCITYNGEIFNFQEVRQELTGLGHQFRSETDTEVILAAYAQWGHLCLEKFNGMWAFAIWDGEKQELFLARDRFGIKPLYYLFEEGKRFVFASETRAFKFLPGFVREFDETLLQHNLADPYSLEGIGYTPFRGILQLLPAHYLVVRKKSGLQQRRWWHIRDHVGQEVPATLEAQAEKFYTIFRDACRIRLVSDVPVATALSGGLDSTSVYTTVFDILEKGETRRVNKDSQRAFTAIFPGLPNDERRYAESAARFTRGRIEFVETDYSSLGERLQREAELGDYVSGSPVTAVSAVYEGMRKAGVVVSMDGHGVDEMLYGYRDTIYTLYNDSLWNGSMNDAMTYAGVLQHMYADENKARERFDAELEAKAARERNIFRKLKRLISPAPVKAACIPLNLPPLSDKPYDFSQLPLPERILYHEFFQHTLPALLRNFDRAGMMNSIEIRMPFMDWRLVSYVFSLPLTSRMGQGFTKLVLREAMKGRMPEDLRTRTFKVGISSPLEHWMSGLKGWAAEMLRDGQLKQNLMTVEPGNGHFKAISREVWQKLNLQFIR